MAQLVDHLDVLLDLRHKCVLTVPVRDTYLNEIRARMNPVWCGFYVMAVLIFMTHACLGWAKLHCRGVCVAERFVAHLCGLEAKLGIRSCLRLINDQLNLTITGLKLLTLMIIQVFEFRLADTEQYFLRPPPTLINWWPS